MLLFKKVQKEIKKEQLHVIAVCLRNGVAIEDVGNVFPEFPNACEHEWMKLNHFHRQNNFTKSIVSKLTRFEITPLRSHIKRAYQLKLSIYTEV